MGLPLPGRWEEVERFSAPVTLGLVVANTLVYLATSYDNLFLQVGDRWIGMLAFVPAYFARPEHLYRLFTSMFLHANLAHIFFNMLFLYTFGRGVESVMGSRNYLALYVTSGLLASFFHTAFLPLEGATSAFIPALGASGAISGVLGAYLLLFPGTRLTMCFFYFYFPVCFTTRAAVYLIFWFALQILQGLLPGASLGVAVFAHAGGFIGGLALLPLLVSRERLETLRFYSSMRSFFRNIFFTERGFSQLGKYLLAFLIGIVAVTAVYSAIASESMGGVSKVLAVSVVSGGSTENESIIIQLSPEGLLDVTPIASSGVRVVVNRLKALNLLYRYSSAGESVSIQETSKGIVNDVPVDVSIRATLTFDRFGLLDSGSGHMTTDVLACDPYGFCRISGKGSYEFSVAPEGTMVGLKGVPVLELSLLSLVACMVAVSHVLRAERYAIVE
jgi:membrane associated rhomboid family serine protease